MPREVRDGAYAKIPTLQSAGTLDGYVLNVRRMKRVQACGRARAETRDGGMPRRVDVSVRGGGGRCRGERDTDGSGAAPEACVLLTCDVYMHVVRIWRALATPTATCEETLEDVEACSGAGVALKYEKRTFDA